MCDEEESAAGVGCPKCGKPIPAWAPDENCPGCMFGMPSLPSAGPGDRAERIGDWVLREPLGEGAFGIVHRVEQLEPVQRTGAMKVLRPGLSTPEVLARFESECQALALLDHPDIVTIHEVGTTDDERPYLVMEFVDGVPVTELTPGLSLEAALDLFDGICSSVGHAHQRGIIHRDIKPSNILGSEDGTGGFRFKLLDFGIARASGKGEFDSTLLTSDGQFLGTPEYMSPEQSSGDFLDIRTDIFSLGVICYEMLTGQTPHRITDHSVEGLIDFFRRVKEEEPARVSLHSGKQVGKDLDAIIRTAMHPDREHRYGSVAELRDDLRRYRERKPVRAQRPDRIYIASRFLQRHWKSVLVTGLFAATLAGATALSLDQMRQARQAESETKKTLAESAYFEAVEDIRDGDIAGGMDLLVQALTTNPDHKEASRLFRGVMASYEIPEVRELPGPKAGLINFAFFSDDPTMVVTEGGILRRENLSYRVGGSHHRVEFDPAGRWMAIAPLEGGLYLYDIDNEIAVPRIELEGNGPSSRVLDVAFSKDSRFLFVANSRRSVARVDIEKGELEWKTGNRFPSALVAVSTDGKRVAVASETGLVALLDAETGAAILKPIRIETPLRALVAIGRNRCLLVGIRGIEVRSFSDLSNVQTGPGFSTRRIVHTVSEEASLIAFGTDDECVVWNYEDGTVVYQKPLKEKPIALKLAGGGRPFLAVADRLEGVEIVNFRTGEPHAVRARSVVNPVSLAFSPNGNRLYAATRDARYYEVNFGEGKRILCEVESREELSEYQGEPRQTFSGVSRDSTLGYAGYRDGTIRVWRLSDGEALREWKATDSRLPVGVLSPDGRLFAWRDAFRKVRIMDIESGESFPCPEVHERDVTSISFSPDSTYLASANYEGVVNVAPATDDDGVTLTMRHDLYGEPSRHFCRFSPDGSSLLSWGASDQTVRVWDVKNEGVEILSMLSKSVPVFADINPEHSVVAILLGIADSTQVVELRSTRTGELVFPPISCESIEEVRFSEDGNALLLRGKKDLSLEIPKDSPVGVSSLSEWKVPER